MKKRGKGRMSIASLGKLIIYRKMKLDPYQHIIQKWAPDDLKTYQLMEKYKIKSS